MDKDKLIMSDLQKNREGGQRPNLSRRAFLTAGAGVGTLLLAACAGLGPSNDRENAGENQSSGGGTVAQDVVSDLPAAPKKDHPAPNFTLARLDGGELTLAELRGSPVILNFWASWCGPCRLEMPHLQEVSTEQGEDLVVLGINLTQRENNMDEVPAFVEEFGLTFPIVLDEDGDVAKLYQVRGQPASVFIDADGIVQTVFYGPVTKDFIEERLSELRA